MKKILHTITWFAPGGGVDKELLLLLSHQVQKYRVTLLVGRDQFHKDFESVDGLIIVTCPWLVSRSSPLRDLIALFWLIKFLVLNRFDLIHTHETKSSLLTRLANTLSRRKLIYGIHGVVFNDRRNRVVNLIYRLIEKFSIILCDEITVVGSDVMQTYHSFGIGKSKKWNIVPSGIDTSLFEAPVESQIIDDFLMQNQIPLDALIWINIGRFSNSKNQIDSLNAFAIFAAKSKRQTHLIFFGDGPNINIVKARYIELSEIMGKVHFVGAINNLHEVARIGYAQIFTSLREGVPRAVVECGLMSIPTISYTVDGIKEIISNGETGVITNQNSVDDLVIQMEKLASNRDYRDRLGHAARQKAKIGWDASKMNKTVDEIYSAIFKDNQICSGGKS